MSSDKGAAAGVEDLTNADMLNIIADAVETSQKASFDSGIKEYVKAFGTEISSVKEMIGGMQQTMIKQAAHTNVANVRAKHKDLNDYKEDINVLLEKTPGLELEDAYILAKAKKHNGIPDKKIVETERPNAHMTNTEQRPVSERQRQAPKVSGTRAFRQILQAGVDKIIDGRTSDYD